MNRVAIVTGGTRGIGRAICEQLKADGLTVIANYAGNEDEARRCAEWVTHVTQNRIATCLFDFA